MSNPNPMHSRCGLEDCDCGYVIEKLVKGLEAGLAYLPTCEGRDGYDCGPERPYGPKCLFMEARVAIAKAKGK